MYGYGHGKKRLPHELVYTYSELYSENCWALVNWRLAACFCDRLIHIVLRFNFQVVFSVRLSSGFPDIYDMRALHAQWTIFSGDSDSMYSLRSILVYLDLKE